MLIGLIALMIEDQLLDIVFFLIANSMVKTPLQFLYCVFIEGNLVAWRSKKQSVVSRSTAEAEYMAMSVGLSETLWVRNLLLERAL